MVSIENKKINPSKKIIDDVKMQIIYIPLESSYGYKYIPKANVGDYVHIDDILGINPDANFQLKSTVSGTIVGIDKKYISNGKLVDCFVIENDFKEKTNNKLGKKKDITKYSKAFLIQMLKQSGITEMSETDYPIFIKYDYNKKYNYLIVNGIESDILSSADSAVMYNHPQEILECIDALMEIMNIKKAYIAISEDNTQVSKKLLRYINTYPNIPIGWIISQPRSQVGSQGKCWGVDSWFEKWTVAIKEVCGHYSIPVLDLYHESNLRPWIDAHNKMYFSCIHHCPAEYRLPYHNQNYFLSYLQIQKSHSFLH